MTVKDTKEATVEIRKDGELVASVRHCDVVGSSVELGPSFDVSIRVWYDEMDNTGGLFVDGKMVAVVRSELRNPVRKATEAAIWEANTGDVSTLCDGRDDFTDVSYINMGDL